MKRLYAGALLVCLLPLPAYPQSIDRPSWSAADAALAGAFLTGLWLDARQTRRLANGGWRDYRETNPVLGPRPSVGQIDTYTALAAVTTLGIASVLPPKTRRWFLAAANAVEVYALAGMAHAGVSIRVF